MNVLNDITDEEFVPFLHSLGVNTCKKSFEWMLNDPDFAGVLHWLYKNLDHNNALSAREQYRYAELEKQGYLMSPEDLEAKITCIQEEYPSICLPGEKDAVEDVKVNINMQKEKLKMLEKQERVTKNLIKRNELIKEELNLELTKLNSAQQQYIEDQSTAAEECLTLADEVETLTEGVVDTIADTLDVYSKCHVDKDISKKFLTFGPLESYRQSQALFRSHFDLYTSRKFGRRKNDSITDDDFRAALIEAKNMEDRLSDAMCAYIESKAELCGEQAKLVLVSNYSVVHPSQATALSMEAQSALELLVQEESILDQQIQVAVKDLVHSRTKLAVETTTRSALAIREQLLTDLSHLLDTSQQALALDRLLYCLLRHELRTLEQCLQFGAQLRQYVLAERDAVCGRVESMNDICSEQEACEHKLQSSDPLLTTLYTILGVKPSNDALPLVKLYAELQNKVREHYGDVVDAYRKKEEAIVAFKQSTQPLRDFTWDGCTKQPNCWNRTVAALTHSLKQELERVEKKVVDVGGSFSSVKNGEKQNLRKLWQWFLTDQARLMAAVKGIQPRNY